jgi:hypothetical protein
MSEEFKYTTKAEIIKQNMKEEFAMEIVDPCYRVAVGFSDTSAEIESFCDELQTKFDQLVDLLAPQALEDMFFFRNPTSDITPTRKY